MNIVCKRLLINFFWTKLVWLRNQGFMNSLMNIPIKRGWAYMNALFFIKFFWGHRIFVLKIFNWCLIWPHGRRACCHHCCKTKIPSSLPYLPRPRPFSGCNCGDHCDGGNGFNGTKYSPSTILLIFSSLSFLHYFLHWQHPPDKMKVVMAATMVMAATGSSTLSLLHSCFFHSSLFFCNW